MNHHDYFKRQFANEYIINSTERKTLEEGVFVLQYGRVSLQRNRLLINGQLYMPVRLVDLRIVLRIFYKNNEMRID